MGIKKEQVNYIWDNRREVGHRLYELRQERGRSIDEVSKISGLSRLRIEHLEQGKGFDLRRVAVVAAVYNHKLKFELVKA